MHVLARALILDTNRILLCKRITKSPQFYYLPGGHVEEQERVEDALERELKEELGWENIEIESFVGCIEYIFPFQEGTACCHTHEYNFIFLIKNQERMLSSFLKREAHIAFEWVGIETLTDLDVRPYGLAKYLQKSFMDNSFFASL